MMILGFATAAAIGTLLRWRLSELLPRPTGTLLANLAGAFLLGWLSGSSGSAHTILGVAAIGSLTTFSTLMIELLELGRDRPRAASVYVVVTIVGGIGLAWLGLTLA